MLINSKNNMDDKFEVEQLCIGINNNKLNPAEQTI